jgi:hypothetical protein
MTTIQLALVLVYRILLIGAVMYAVGYLDWSAWWLLLFAFIPTFDAKEEK